MKFLQHRQFGFKTCSFELYGKCILILTPLAWALKTNNWFKNSLNFSLRFRKPHVPPPHRRFTKIRNSDKSGAFHPFKIAVRKFSFPNNAISKGFFPDNQAMFLKCWAWVLYDPKRAYFNKFTVIRRWNPPKQHTNLKFLE